MKSVTRARTPRASPALAGALVVCALALAPLGAGETTATDASCWPGAEGSDPALCPPDDPKFDRHWEFRHDIPAGVDRERMHPAERALGAIGISLYPAWQLTTGSDEVVIAVLDSGIRWTDEDLRRKLFINRGELPPPEGPEGPAPYDQNDDGVFDVEDYAQDPRVSDLNENGVLDAGDLIRRFSDCRDDDGNGYVDDISGYDFFAGDHCGVKGSDNDPHDATDFGHGTGIAGTAAGETDNGIDDVGVCPECRVLPVRVGDSFVVDVNRFARGVIYSVHAGADVIASALGSYNNTPAGRYAVDFAYERGVPLITSAADEYSYHHNYPSVYNHTLYVNAIRYNHRGDWEKASTFWGLNPCTNFGARVWVTVPAESCSSGATSRLAGVAGLVQSMAVASGLGPLHAEEVYQLLRATADDLDSRTPDWGIARWPAKPGFDQIYGYGRVHAERAVRAVRDRQIPPIVDLDNPRWFEIVSPVTRRTIPVSGRIELRHAREATYELHYALGVEPSPADYISIGGGRVDGVYEGLLGVVDFDELPIPAGSSPRNREERDRYSVTIRLRATDDRGRIAEDRRSFFVFHDPTWKRGFPVDLGASGEAPPTLYDLNGDGRDEIVVPGADGYLRIFSADVPGLRLTRVALDLGPPLGPPGTAPDALEDELRRETVIRGVAIGDINGDGTPAIVVASRDGKVYAFSGRGERLGGFPVEVQAELRSSASPTRQVERGILSTPVLADLDGEPGLEIVVSSLDGQLYVWKRGGKLVEGFPVPLANHRSPDDVADKIVSTPAVGDVDGDGSPEIVVGSNGLRGGLAAAYAVRARGLADPAGPFLPGWPVEVAGLRPDLLPTLATGIQMSPILVDVDRDGDLEVVLYAVTGSRIHLIDQSESDGPQTLARYSMMPAPSSALRGVRFLGGTGSALLADTDGDGRQELYAPLLPMRMITMRIKPGVPLDVPLALGGWEIGSETTRVSMLPGYPRRMEDMMIYARPGVADVDADGFGEVLMGSGGYLLHAFARSGGEAPGFPKFTGGWTFSAPAAGDIDGDGLRELVSVTREGYLFAWELDREVDPGREVLKVEGP